MLILNAVCLGLFEPVGNGWLVVSMNNMTLTKRVMLLVVAWCRFNEVNVNSTSAASQSENVLPNRR